MLISKQAEKKGVTTLLDLNTVLRWLEHNATLTQVAEVAKVAARRTQEIIFQQLMRGALNDRDRPRSSSRDLVSDALLAQGISVEALSGMTGITVERLQDLQTGKGSPLGDEEEDLLRLVIEAADQVPEDCDSTPELNIAVLNHWDILTREADHPESPIFLDELIRLRDRQPIELTGDQLQYLAERIGLSEEQISEQIAQWGEVNHDGTEEDHNGNGNGNGDAAAHHSGGD